MLLFILMSFVSPIKIYIAQSCIVQLTLPTFMSFAVTFALVAAEGGKPRNQRILDLDFAQQLASAAEFLAPVSREEDVTNNVEAILLRFSSDQWDLSGGFCFPQQNINRFLQNQP